MNKDICSEANIQSNILKLMNNNNELSLYGGKCVASCSFQGYFCMTGSHIISFVEPALTLLMVVYSIPNQEKVCSYKLMHMFSKNLFSFRSKSPTFLVTVHSTLVAVGRVKPPPARAALWDWMGSGHGSADLPVSQRVGGPVKIGGFLVIHGQQ